MEKATKWWIKILFWTFIMAGGILTIGFLMALSEGPFSKKTLVVGDSITKGLPLEKYFKGTDYSFKIYLYQVLARLQLFIIFMRII